MAESFARRAAIEYAKTMRAMALRAGLHRAAMAVQPKVINDQKAQVVVPRELAPNAYVFNYGLRHPENYPNQVNAKHPKAWMRHMARTPKRPFLTWTQADIDTADRVLEGGADDLIKEAWDNW